MIVKIFVSHAKIARSMIKVIAIRLFIGGIKMDFKNDGIIGNLPKNINAMPTRPIFIKKSICIRPNFMILSLYIW